MLHAYFSLNLFLILSVTLSFYSVHGLPSPLTTMNRLRSGHTHKNPKSNHLSPFIAPKVSSFSAGLQSHAKNPVNFEDWSVEDYLGTCNEFYFKQKMDHFNPVDSRTFDQRYFVCGLQGDFGWKSNSHDPIFFYSGNEANVEAYLKYTGLMWENAYDFNALVIFAEHRFYGKSRLFENIEDVVKNPSKHLYLQTVDQAMADYAVLLTALKRNDLPKIKGASKSPIISFGGSYGGMLSAWLRSKYPHLIDGAIAASAPVLGVSGLDPPCDSSSFAAIETKDALEDSQMCVDNFKRVWDVLKEYIPSKRHKIGHAFNLCADSIDPDKIGDSQLFWALYNRIEMSIAYMAMSSYPYPSGYITQAMFGANAGPLPAYPVEYACKQGMGEVIEDDDDLLKAVQSFLDVFYGAIANDEREECVNLFDESNDESDDVESQYNGLLWDAIWCNDLRMPSSTNGVTDMFIRQDWNAHAVAQWCSRTFGTGLEDDPEFSQRISGRSISKSMTNIVFSNGDLDPWAPLGVLTADDRGKSSSLELIMIEKGGHHLDLMFSHPLDTHAVKNARKKELGSIRRWIDQVKDERPLGAMEGEAFCQAMSSPSNPWYTAFSMMI